MHTWDLSHDLASACTPAPAPRRLDEEPTGAFTPPAPPEEQSSGSRGVASLWSEAAEQEDDEEEPWLLPEDEVTDEVQVAPGPEAPCEELTCDLDTRSLQPAAADATLDELLDLPAWALDPI